MFTAGGEEKTESSENEDSTTPVENSEPIEAEDSQGNILEKSDAEILEERFIGDNPIPEKTESVEDKSEESEVVENDE